MSTSSLIANNSEINANIKASEHTIGTTDTSSKANLNHSDSLSHAAHAEHKVDPQEELTSSLDNHYGFVWSNYHVIDLPFIIYDKGLHFYGNEQSLNESGLFKLVEEHPGHKKLEKVGGGQPQLDMSITNFVFFQFLAIALISFVFLKAKNAYQASKSKAPSGIQNVLEHIILWVRDEIVRPNLPSRVIADKMTPYLTVLFFFILTINYMGMLPGAHTATSDLSVTGALALTAFLMVNVNAIRMSGVGHFLHHLLGGAPWYMGLLMVPLEIIGIIIKPVVLTLRLFANMKAGHLLLTSLTGVIIISKMMVAAVPIVPFSIFIMLIEVLVCLIQAFIFTLLTTIFISLAVGDHPKEKFSDGHHLTNAH